MTRSGTSSRRGTDGHEPPTHAHDVAKRRSVVRFVAGMFGICVVAAVTVADSEVRPGNTAALVRDFPQLQSRVKAAIGIALAPVGGSAPLLSFGEWRSGPAWSTMKVPLVIAALRDTDPSHITDQMNAAIIESDNVAAEAIWAWPGRSSNRGRQGRRRTGGDRRFRPRSVPQGAPGVQRVRADGMAIDRASAVLIRGGVRSQRQRGSGFDGHDRTRPTMGPGHHRRDAVQGRLGTVTHGQISAAADGADHHPGGSVRSP